MRIAVFIGTGEAAYAHQGCGRSAVGCRGVMGVGKMVKKVAAEHLVFVTTVIDPPAELVPVIKLVKGLNLGCGIYRPIGG